MKSLVTVKCGDSEYDVVINYEDNEYVTNVKKLIIAELKATEAPTFGQMTIASSWLTVKTPDGKEVKKKLPLVDSLNADLVIPEEYRGAPQQNMWQSSSFPLCRVPFFKNKKAKIDHPTGSDEEAPLPLTLTHKASIDAGRMDIPYKFVESIGISPIKIEESDHMLVMKGVIDLELEKGRDVIIRKVTEPFWKACIDCCEQGNRVCAIGTPGIGKTTCTCYLIRMLLLKRRTVIYLIRSENGDSYYYEFVPDKSTVRVTAYPETTPRKKIPSLLEPETFYIVDPGRTENTCDLPIKFLSNVIIISSPDSRHWGGSEFEKNRGLRGGLFKYFPVWELEELVAARTLFEHPLKAETVEERFRQVGGVPSHIFCPVERFRAFLDIQDRAVNALTSSQVENIAFGKVDAVETLTSQQPKSAIMGYVNAHGDADFSVRKVAVISPSVAEKIFSTHMNELWNKMFREGDRGWHVFETYTRLLMAQTQAVEFDCRVACGKRHPQYVKISKKNLGGCKRINLTLDIIEAAKKTESVIFHSTKRCNELIDFVYKDTNDRIHAFQVTIGSTHPAKEDAIQRFEAKIEPFHYSLYYLVPGEQFQAFVTNPAEPNVTQGDVWHVLIPNPAEQTPLIPTLQEINE